MGLYDLLLFRTDGTVLTGFGSTSDIFNADHENHVTHTAAEFLNSWEEDVTQMRLTSAPTLGSTSLSLPTTLAGEIERLRYQIARIKQQMAGAATPPFWYTAPADFSNAIQLAAVAGRVELTSVQNVPNATFTTVLFNATSYLVGGVTRSPGLLHAPVDGVYTCGASLGFGDGVTTGFTGYFFVVLQVVSGGVATNIASAALDSTVDEPKFITVEGAARLTAASTIRVIIHQNSGSTKAIVSEVDGRPAMWMALMGRG